MTTFDVGRKLVELCKQDKNLEAVNTLYSPNVVSIEAMPMPGHEQKQQGIEAVRKKAEWWYQNHEIHKAETVGPWPHGDRFIVMFKYDVTAKTGPMAGKRMQVEEAALFTVKDGKVIQEEFFYHMG